MFVDFLWENSMAAKKKIEQTDILPESQTVETVAETTDSEAAEATEQAIETKGSENGGKIEAPGGDSGETKVTPSPESETTETPAQTSTEQTATPQTDDSSTVPAVPELSTDEKGGGNDKTDDTDKTSGDKNTAAKTLKMVLKHKSHTPHYHRCGLTLTKTFAEYEVPAESVEKLKADKWIVVQESK